MSHTIHSLARYGRVGLVILTIISLNFSSTGLVYSIDLPVEPGLNDTITESEYLEVQKKFDPASPAGQANYIISYKNVSSETLYHAVLNDALPGEFDYMDSMPMGQNTNGVVEWKLGTLPSGMEGEVRVMTTVKNDALENCVEITNSATVKAERLIPNTLPVPTYLPVQAMDEEVQTFCQRVPDLTVTKTIAENGELDGAIDYIIEYANVGEWPAFEVAITDTLPLSTIGLEMNAQPIPTENGQATWEIGTIEPGATGTLAFRMYFDSAAVPCGSLTNEVMIAQTWVPDPTNPTNINRFEERNLTNNSSVVATETHYGECDGMMTGQVWHDTDADGAQEEGEPVLPGWTVNLLVSCSNDVSHYDYAYNDQVVNLADFIMWTELYEAHDFQADLNHDDELTQLDLRCFSKWYTEGTIAEPMTVFDSVITDDNGQYTFTDLLPGKYWLSETMQPEWFQSYPGLDPVGPIEVTEAAKVSGSNFGNYQMGQIAGAKWNDLNGDGVWQTEAEPTLADWPITLWKDVAGIQTLLASQTTDADGQYRFEALMPGNYVVKENVQSELGWSQTKPGTADESYGPITLSSGLVSEGNEFGNWKKPVAPVDNEGETTNPPPVIVPPNPTASVPVLTLTKVIDARSFVNPGAVINYTVTLKNTGTAPASNVIMTDTLPAAMFFTDVLGSTRTLVPGGELGVGDTLTLTYPATVKADAISGTYTNTVRVTANNHPTLTAGVALEVRSPQVLGDAAAAALTIEKTSEQSVANPGDIVTYTVKITNAGDAPSVNTTLHDVLPVGATFTETGGSVRDWNLGTLEAGQQQIIRYEATIDGSAGEGTYQNTAVVKSDNAASENSGATIEVRMPTVLGAETSAEAETLATTGAGLFDYFLIMLAGLTFAGAIIVATQPKLKVRRVRRRA